MKGAQNMLFCHNYIKPNLERNTTEPNIWRCFCDFESGSQMIYDTTKQSLETWCPIKDSHWWKSVLSHDLQWRKIKIWSPKPYFTWPYAAQEFVPGTGLAHSTDKPSDKSSSWIWILRVESKKKGTERTVFSTVQKTQYALYITEGFLIFLFFLPLQNKT